MGFFNELNTDEVVNQERDSIGGFGAVETALYNCMIKKAYAGKSAGGANCVTIELEMPDKKIHKETIYISSKAGKVIFGYNVMNSLSLLAIGKEFKALDADTKTINLYNFDQKKEVPTEVPMFMELVNQPITAGIVRRIENKSKQKADKSGWEDINEKRTINVVDKFFRASDGLTVTEIKAGATEAKFRATWDEKKTGNDDDRYKEVVTSGNAGAPAASGTDAPKENLFL